MADNVVEINTEVWRSRLALLVAATGQTMREALYEEWPLLIRKVMDFTPPFQSGGGSSSDLSVGRAAVDRDIRKTMRPFDPQARTKSIEKIEDERNVDAFNIIASRVKSGPMAGARAVAFSPEVHTSQRNSRGRVDGYAQNRVVLGSDAALLQKYISEVQSRVGIAKAGWWPALALVGGDAPSFVTKHGMGFGDYIDDHSADDPSITAINRTPWASRQDEGHRIIQAALASRAEAIVSKVRTKLRLAAKERAGFEVAA